MALISQWTKAGVLIQTINIAATNPLPYGITTDGKFLWLIDNDAFQIEQYDKSGNFIQAFAAPLSTNNLADITTDRKFLWIASN